jgi:hypothetical protein
MLLYTVLILKVCSQNEVSCSQNGPLGGTVRRVQQSLIMSTVDDQDITSARNGHEIYIHRLSTQEDVTAYSFSDNFSILRLTGVT